MVKDADEGGMPVEKAARAALAAAGLPADPATAHLTAIAGLTNRVFAAETAEGRFLVRLPGPHTIAYIDREAEAHNAREAARIGVGPAVIHTAPDGTMVTAFVEGAEPLAAGSTLPRPTLVSIARCFAKLHRSTAAFRGRFDAPGAAERYVARRPPAAETSTRMAAILDRMREVPAALGAGTRLAPCHCDPVPGNILIAERRALLLDWEYSGIADPLWDLAYFAAAADLPADDETALHQAYFGRSASRSDRARITLHKAQAAGLAAAWALMRHADTEGPAAAAFSAYAAASLAEAERRFSAEDFVAVLDTARHG